MTDNSGIYVRPASRFRHWVEADPKSEFPAEKGRYHLYVSSACPWSHRTIIGRRLKGLEDTISISFMDPYRDDKGWAFTGGQYVDQINSFDFLRQAYQATESTYDGRISSPVLWDKKTKRIVNNESGDILRMFTTGFDGMATTSTELYPAALQKEIDNLNDDLYDKVNNAVYSAGFSTNQHHYESVVNTLFDTFDKLEKLLSSQRFLFGYQPVETDWRLFVTLARFDAAYFIHFKTSRHRLIEYPNLWAYARDLYQHPGIADTVKMDEIRTHYFRTHPQINPSGLIAVEPASDWNAPHDRQNLIGS